MVYDSKKRTFRIGTDKNTSASVETGEYWSSITGGDPSNFFLADDAGVHIGGKLSYQGMPHQMVFGGLSRFNLWPLLFFPIGPTLIPNLPLANLTSTAQQAKSMSKLLAVSAASGAV